MNVSSLLRAVAQSIQRPHIKCDYTCCSMVDEISVKRGVCRCSLASPEREQGCFCSIARLGRIGAVAERGHKPLPCSRHDPKVCYVCTSLSCAAICSAMDGWTVEDRSISHQREAETISGDQESSSPIEGEGQRGIKKRKKAKNRQEKVKKQKKAEASARRSTEKLPLILTAKGMKKHVISRVRPVGDGT